MARDNRVMAPHGGLELSGSLYLFDYVPTQSGGRQKFEIYAFVLNADATTANGRYGLHVQSRARDTKLRDFFLSNFWFQEAYGWRKTAAGEVHVGKFYRKVGLLWDDSFFGNVQYFNGLKLNPDAGVELVGSRPAGGATLDYSAQYFVSNDRVAGALPGRDAASDSTGTLRNVLTARVAPTFSMRAGASLGLGLSGLVGRLDRPAGGSFDVAQGAADLTLSAGPSVSYLEILYQSGERNDARHPRSRPGYDDATYVLAGTRWQLCRWMNARFNASQANYVGGDAREVELVPGAVIALDKNLNLIAEYDWWKLYPRGGARQTLDTSLNFVLNYNF